jgi:hypothetical protein
MITERTILMTIFTLPETVYVKAEVLLINKKVLISEREHTKRIECQNRKKTTKSRTTNTMNSLKVK